MREELTADQKARMSAAAQAFDALVPAPLQSWLDDLARETDRERHLHRWEVYAEVMRKYTKPADPLRRKREVFELCLSFATSISGFVDSKRPTMLTDEEVDAITGDLAEKLSL